MSGINENNIDSCYNYEYVTGEFIVKFSENNIENFDELYDINQKYDVSSFYKLFNDCDFFAAHDYFEEIWMEAKRDEKEFFQGLVQVSVGCYHLICGNIKGAKSQLEKGISKLSKYEPAYYNLDLSSLTEKVKILIYNIDNKSIINREIPTIELIN